MTSFVHVTLGRVQRPADDPFGRPFIGYDPFRSAAELWEVNRGYWKLDPTRLERCDLAVFSHQGTVVLVAELTGAIESKAFGKYSSRWALEGHPIEHHDLIGRPQPIPRSTGNPIGYGSL